MATFNPMHDGNAVVVDVTLAGVGTRARACWPRASNTRAGRPAQKDEFLPSRELPGLLEKDFKLAANFVAMV